MVKQYGQAIWSSNMIKVWSVFFATKTEKITTNCLKPLSNKRV